MAASFVLPFLVWCFVSYAGFLWDKEYELTLTPACGDKGRIPATYKPGDTLTEAGFRDYQDAIREENRAMLDRRFRGDGPSESPRAIRDANRKVLRSFEPVMVANGWFDPRAATDSGIKDYKELYARTYETWGRLASGQVRPEPGTLSEENREIIAQNWAWMKEVSPRYESSQFISAPLLKLIPAGEKGLALPSYLPAPHEVFGRMARDFTGRSPLGDLRVGERYLSSLGVVFGGFALAVSIGLPLALLAGTFAFFSRLFEPFADFFRYMPAPAFGVVLMAVFGIYQAPKYALVFLGTFPHAILMIAKTTRLLDRSLLEAAQTLGASKAQLLKRVVIPGVLPHVYNDLRILLGWAWTWLVIAELIGEKSGLTAIIDTQGRRFHFETVYPIILVIGVTGFCTDQVLSGLRPLLFPWVVEGKRGLVAKVALAVTWLPRRIIALAPRGELRAVERERAPKPTGSNP